MNQESKKSFVAVERVGAHDAIVFHGENGSRIILLEDSTSASGPQRLAFREMKKLMVERVVCQNAIQFVLDQLAPADGKPGQQHFLCSDCLHPSDDDKTVVDYLKALL
jgi:hypothetical protein